MRLLLIIAIAVIICIFTSTSIDASNLRKLRATIDVKSESSMTLSTPPAWMVLKLKWTCYHHRTKIKHCPLDKCPKHYYKPGESHEKFGAPAPPPNDSKGGGTISGSVNSGSYYGHGSATIPHLIERSSDMIYSGKHNMDTYVALTTLEALQVVCTCKFVCNKPKQDEPKLLLEMDAMTDADADAEAEADIEALSEASMDDEFEVGVQADTDTEAEGSVDASTDAVAGTKFETALEADMNADEGLEQDMEMETDIDTENNALSESESASALSVYNPPPQWLLTVYNDIKAGKGKKYAIHKLDVLHRLALEWTCYNHRKKIKHCPLNDCPKHYYKPGEDHEKFPAPKGPPNNGYHGGTVSYHVGGGGSSPYPHGAVTVPHLIERSSTMSHNENHQLKQHHDMDTYVGLTTLEALQLVCTCKFVCNKPKGEPFSKQVLAAFGVLMEMGTHVNTDADVGVYAKIDNDIELDSDADADIDADTDADVDAEEAFFLQQEMDGYG